MTILCAISDTLSIYSSLERRGVFTMSIDDVMYLARDAMLVTLLISAPMLISGMVVGLLISVLQSVTQIQEITLSFVPKIFFVMLTFVLFLPWMVNTMRDFVVPLFGSLEKMI